MNIVDKAVNYFNPIAGRERDEAFDMRRYALAGLELLQIDLNELAKIDRNNLTKLFSKNKAKERKRILSKGVSSE